MKIIERRALASVKAFSERFPSFLVCGARQRHVAAPLAALGVVLLLVLQATANSWTFRNAGIGWRDSLGLYSPVNKDAPGCCMCFNYWECWEDQTTGSITTDWTTGAPCSVLRDGVKIAEIPGAGDPAWFSDYDVVPGMTYTYEIIGARGGRTVEMSVKCSYIYKAEIAESELSFAADDDYSTVKNAALLYKQTENSTSPAYPWEIQTSCVDGGNWIGGECDERGRIRVWVDPNEADTERTGHVTIKLEGMEWVLKVKQAGRMTGTTYSSWAEENGIGGAWSDKDASGVYNVFRYAFDVPSGGFATPLIDITFRNGSTIIKTPPLVNTAGFTFSVVASDKPDGTGNVVPYSLDSLGMGETVIDEAKSGSRFFRLKVTEGQ